LTATKQHVHCCVTEARVRVCVALLSLCVNNTCPESLCASDLVIRVHCGYLLVQCSSILLVGGHFVLSWATWHRVTFAWHCIYRASWSFLLLNSKMTFVNLINIDRLNLCSIHR